MTEDSRYKALTTYHVDLSSYLTEPISEADTRAKFIDVFLKDILGWHEDDLRRERTFWTDAGRAAIDYEVGCPRPLFLVEAKRLSIDFELPDDSGRLLYKLDGVIKSYPNLWGAIQQARTYCDEQGIPFGFVSNGKQFALFRAISINKPWREGHALLVDIETLLKKHFVPVHDTLCYENASIARIDALLEHTPNAEPGVRIADSLGAQVGRLSNRLSDVMEEMIGVILRDQPEPNREFLEQCYSMDPSVDFYAKSLQGLLKDSAPFFSPEVGSVRPGHKKDPFGKAISALLDRQGTRPPVVIIGGKGFGKTTFLQWFMKASAFKTELQGQVVLWVDFRPTGFAAPDVDHQVRRLLVSQLENSTAHAVNTFGGLKAVFKDRIEVEKKRFLLPYMHDEHELEKRTAELIQEWRSDNQGYLLALVVYAVSHCDKRVVIVLDNSDQKASDFQVAVYNVAQQLAVALPVTLLVTLRESTFYRLCRLPQGDAFSQQQVFHIRAPNIQSVLRQRFAFLGQQFGRVRPVVRSTSGIDLTITNIEQFIKLLERSLLEGRDSPLIVEMLAAISNGSVRESLNLVHDFLVSGHTKMEDYVWNYALNAQSAIPYHEFLVSVLLDEMAFFTEDHSHFFVNLFARSALPGDSHFTRLRLLYLIRSISPGNEFRPDDYVALSAVRSRILAIGVPGVAFDSHMQTLIRYGLVQTDTQTVLDEPGDVADDYNRVSSVHIAASGQYYLDTLASRFQYLMRVIPDIPIASEDTLKMLKGIFIQFKSKPAAIPMEYAVECVEKLLGYLDVQEKHEHASGFLSRDPVLSSYSFVDGIRVELEPQFVSIRKWLSRRDAQ